MRSTAAPIRTLAPAALALAAMILTLAAPASAFVVPKSAKTLKGEFITAHVGCTTPNIVTTGPFG